MAMTLEQKARRNAWYAENKLRVSAQRKAKRDERRGHPPLIKTTLEEKRAKKKLYDTVHAERINAQRRARRAANPEKTRDVMRSWIAAHRDRKKRCQNEWYSANRARVLLRRKAREKTELGRERLRAQRNAWAKANASKLAAASKVRRAAQPEKSRARGKAWREAYPERNKANRKAWRAANPERTKLIARRAAATRRAKKKGVFFEIIDPVVVFARDKGKCGICKCKVNKSDVWELDHVIAIAKGGTHCYANIQLAHAECNRKKGVDLPQGQINLWQVKPAGVPIAETR